MWETAVAGTLILVFCIPYVCSLKCFEGGVTYCGINADGGALPERGGKYYVQGMNWACQDQQSNMDPTFIAPNCWDQESCEALQTDEYDDPFAIAHEPPYNYVADVNFLDRMSDVPEASAKKCTADQPACGLQTSIRRHEGDCEQCYTRFRYSADMGAIYWNIWQIQKACVTPGETCTPYQCNCTREDPYYEGEHCSVWAKAACRRKAYKCEHFPADYVVTTFQDYDIKFCSLGSDDVRCAGCVACTHRACQMPVIHYSQLLPAPDPDVLANLANYNCSMEHCGEAPRTCWNNTCAFSDDCWPVCDPAIYARRITSANMGFYVTSNKGVMVEETKCCESQDWCNYPNPAPAMRAGLVQAIIAAALALAVVAVQA